MSVSRATRRRVERLTSAVQRLYDGDLRFFDRHPDRVFRLRQAGAAEVQQQALIHPGRFCQRPGLRVHTLVRKVTGARLRLYVMAREGMDVDLPEAELAAMWSEWAPSGSDLAAAIAAAENGGAA